MNMEPNISSRTEARHSSDDINQQLELISSFFETRVNDEGLNFYQSMVLDLYRAITCFRMYDSVAEFLEINPELKDCKLDIDELWKEFGKLTQQELAEISLELLQEI
jgi:hypothetical protein